MIHFSIQMITLNEERYIGCALDSLIELEPAYVAIVDGGSTDATQSILKKYQKKLNLIWKEVPWKNDFGAQRQAAFDLGISYADEKNLDVVWWMRLDSDEALPQAFQLHFRNLLARLPEDCLACRIRQVNLYPDLNHYVANIGGWEAHPRIFRHNLEGRWTGQVHEYFQGMTRNGLKVVPDELIYSLALDVLHYGWLNQARREKREKLYSAMPGSGVTAAGDLTGRHYEVRLLPSHLRGGEAGR